ncbi:unnamed protein product, partial [Rangifer tarandus platyrhynchus]
ELSETGRRGWIQEEEASERELKLRTGARGPGVGELASFGLQHLRPQGNVKLSKLWLPLGHKGGIPGPKRREGLDGVPRRGGSCTAARTPALAPGLYSAPRPQPAACLEGSMRPGAPRTPATRRQGPTLRPPRPRA